MPNDQRSEHLSPLPDGGGLFIGQRGRNGEVEVSDFLTLLSEWGPCVITTIARPTSVVTAASPIP